MKQRMKAIIATLTLCLMLPFMMIPASAMTPSPSKVKYGTQTSGLFGMTEGHKIAVENQTITFDIHDLPSFDYGSTEEFNSYNARVTTEYNLINHTYKDEMITVAVPLGTAPEYGVGKLNTELFTASVNGEAVPCSIRHKPEPTDYYYSEKVEFSDEYTEYAFLTPETTVTKYTYRLTNRTDMPYCSLIIDQSGYDGCIIYLSNNGGEWSPDDGSYHVDCSMGDNETTVNLYIIGNVPSEMPSWEFWDGYNSKEKLSGTAEVISTEEISLTDFVFMNYDEKCGISDVDWYNATINEMKAVIDGNMIYAALNSYRCNFENLIYPWCVFDITIPAGERASVVFSAPIYPGIDGGYEPMMYSYSYVFSPEKYWAGYGHTDVIINTPYYLINDREGFTKTDSGYSLYIESLTTKIDEYSSVTDSAVSFDLSESENPEQVKDSNGWAIMLLIVMLIAMPFVLIIEFFSGIVNGIESLFQKVKDLFTK